MYETLIATPLAITAVALMHEETRASSEGRSSFCAKCLAHLLYWHLLFQIQYICTVIIQNTRKLGNNSSLIRAVYMENQISHNLSIKLIYNWIPSTNSKSFF